ncbi:MATH domain and coiled-coil domain-containing protein At3g58270-like isoform X2 [Gastrolobium bilobum]|nr:MATH domain and coiled-coil domain-containing protein At3g58270-like isoform X2 [Gastrolobium bilobum]XP_061372150.1 MATH domain and coiled-coil domain-containing protein At3g58270-like isoform X2 [Gastrolobium bilobum]
MDSLKGTKTDFETFTWKIENFSKQNTKSLRSKAFRIRGYKWRILLYPLRSNVDHFSLYLMVADSLPPYGWSRNTYFKLALINQVDGNKSVVKETLQKFNGGYRSWGSLFVNLKDFYDSEQGYLVNNTCIIEAHICVSDLNTIQGDNLNKNTPTNDSKQSDQETETSDGSETPSSTTSWSSQMEEEVKDTELTLRDLVDLESLGREEAAFVPLLEEACTWHPSLLLSQRKRSSWFKLWAFISLGQVLHFLKTRKVKDMNEDACNHLQGLWEELVKASGFKLDWLEPHVQSALGVKVHMERTVAANELKDRVVALEIKLKKLRGELAAAEDEFELARRELVEARKGYMEIDLYAELGYAMF